MDVARATTPIAFLMEIGKILISREILTNNKKDEFLDDLLKYEDINYVENIHTMMTTAQINTIIFNHLNLNENFTECMKYLDNKSDIPDDIKDMVQALQVVRTAINIEDQLSEHSLENTMDLLKKYNYNTVTFMRAATRLQKKYLE